MIVRSSIAAATVALAFSTASFANDPAKSSSATGSKSPAVTAAECERLTGARKDQCLRQAQQGQSSTGATGATRGSAAGTAATPGSRPTQPAPAK